MHRSLSLILVVAAACGGSSRPPPTAPLPEDPKPASAAPATAEEAKAEPAPAAPTPPPQVPVEVKIPAPQTTVKIVSAGKGKKEAVRYSARPGARQAIELAMDFTGRQDTEEQTVPTIVLTGEAETRAVDKDGVAEYTLTVTGTDVRPVTGSQVPVEQFKAVLGSLSGLTIGGSLAANGTAGETTMRIERAPEHAAEALDLIRLTFPTLPMLPREPVGVGAKWQATTVAKLSDRLDVTQVTDYEVVAHTGSTWKIKGTTKVSGKDQELDGGARVSAITGSGTSETTIADGALYPTHKSSLQTQFKASDKDASTQITIKVGGAVTPR
jgi:hypothetical protein